MRKLLISMAVAAAALSQGASATASDWTPEGPITMMVGFRSGGGADTHARLIAKELEARHGWEIIPVEVAGNSGAVLAERLKDEPADGTVIGLIVADTLGYDLVVAEDPGFAREDLVTITTTAGFQMGLVAMADRGWNTYEDLVSYAKESGEPISVAAITEQLADLAFLLGRETGVDLNIVSMRGGKAAMNAVTAGDVDVGWIAGLQTKSVLAGDMVNLLSGNRTRLTASPDAPTLDELGIEFNAEGYFLFAGPAGMPDDARATMANAIAEIVTDETTEAGRYIKAAFGGGVAIRGAELDAFLDEQEAMANDMLKALEE